MTETVLSEIGSFTGYGGLAFIGGHPGLDFVNSVKYRGAPDDGDRLAEFRDIVKWAYAAGLLNNDECQFLLQVDRTNKHIKKLHVKICAVREAVQIVLSPENHTKQTFETAAGVVERAIAELRPKPRIDRNSGGLVTTIPLEKPSDLKARIVACLEELLLQRAGLKIKTCEGQDCDWMFVDQTKAKRRKWCDTRTCGNNARVRRHREANNRKPNTK